MNDFSHLDSQGRPVMVDVGGKTATARTAVARSVVSVPETVLQQLAGGDIQTKKGAVFATAILAGIMGAKKTGELIPLCHPVGMDHCHVEIRISGGDEIIIDCTASVTAKTGVEMEALVGATVAALTVYDMCKAFSHDIIIRETKLLSKTGGKKDFKRADS